MIYSFGKICVATRAQWFRRAAGLQLHAAFDHKNKALGGCLAEFSSGFKFGSVLRELCIQGGADVYDRGTLFHSRQRRANESVSGQQQMIWFLGTSCAAEIIHGLSFCEIEANQRAAREDASRT